MLKQTLEIWGRAITPGLKPDKAVVTYQTLLQEQDNPTLVKPLIWIVISGLITGAIHGLLTPILVALTGETIDLVLLSGLISGVGNMILIPIIGVIGLVISSAGLLGIAKVLGGKGNFVSQTYVLAAIQAPMTIILTPLRTTVRGLSETPFEVVGLMIGLIILFPLAIYSGWLSIVSLRATHTYSGGSALLTVVIFGGILFGFGCALVVLFGLALSLLA